MKTLAQLLLASLGAGVASAETKAFCPDYLNYSQVTHEPLSTGKYALSYQRPIPACRTFNSSTVEALIANMSSVVADPDLYRLFENTFPNTLDSK
jgi:hypothetical protein